jgi:mannose-6-phosphate isomerase-like protein (cupin superfamily)
MGTETLTKDGVFDLRTPLLKQGLTSDVRAKTDHLTVTIKVYANGGENLMHSHTNQDHFFVVLAGQAVFHLEREGNIRTLNKYEGVMIPKDMEYKFQSAGDGNLVMLRAGGIIPGIVGVEKDKSFIPERIEMPGMFFPDDYQ